MATASERIQEITQATGAAKEKVALDTCCVQYYISNPPVQPWADCLDPIFRAALDGRIELYVSTVVLSELLSHVYFINRHNAGYDPELDLLAIISRHFQVLDVDGTVAKAAGRLRGSYAPADRIVLKTPDCLIGATSLANGHTLFITNDAQLASALSASNCIYLRDVALEWLSQMFPARCFDGTPPVVPSPTGIGVPLGAAPGAVEFGGIQPHASANWRRILKDAQTVAAAVNEPCVFFLLLQKVQRRTVVQEVIFWHASLEETRPALRVIKRLQEHLGYSTRSKTVTKSDRHIRAVICGSLAREHRRQAQPGFASKTEHQRAADAWNDYLSLWRVFRGCLEVPQMNWLLCENGAIHVIDRAAAISFLDRAGNVLGWSDTP